MTACHFCQQPVDVPQKGWTKGQPMYCSAHHVLASRDPFLIGQDALDYASWLNDLTADELVRWPWRAVNELAGPLVPGRLTYVAAFPGGGKTTFLTQCLHYWVGAGKKVLYMPLEANPGEVMARLACLKLGINADDALALRLRQRADEGDPIAQQQVDALTAEYMAMRPNRKLFDLLRIEPVDALNLTTFGRALTVAHAAEVDLVVVDHVDHVESEDGQNTSDIATSNALQTLALKAAKRLSIPMVLASQLNSGRTGGDRLAHYRPPVADWLYNKGKKEQMAANILGLSRVLDPNAEPDALRDVKDGRRDIGTVVLSDRMAVTGMKLRYGGALKERTVQLSYTHGVIRDLDDMEARDGLGVRHGIPTGSPSMYRGRAA